MIGSVVARVALVAALSFVAACDEIGHQLAAAHGGGAPGAPAEVTQPAEAAPVAIAAAAQEAATAAPAPASAPAQQQARFTIDTKLRDLSANPQAKAIVDRYVPGITEGPHAAMAGGYSLREMQAQMPGTITEAQLNQIGAELAAIH